MLASGVINTQEEEGRRALSNERRLSLSNCECLFLAQGQSSMLWNVFLDPLKKCIDPCQKWNFVFQWRQNGDCIVFCRCKIHRVVWLMSVHKPFFFSKIFTDLRPSLSTWFTVSNIKISFIPWVNVRNTRQVYPLNLKSAMSVLRFLWCFGSQGLYFFLVLAWILRCADLGLKVFFHP